ncbi:DUF3494 domain-containing protein [Inquilinus sp. KBS0705]|nr:DUF3494 domain-containing protein [Inquilinus sp. KBS0705]
MNKKTTPTTDGSYMRKSIEYTGVIKAIWSIALLLTIITACKKDNYKGEITGNCPVVVSTDPTDKAIDVVLNKVITATFNTNMAAASINDKTFLIKQGSNIVSGKVAATADAKVFTFTPDQPLLPFVLYNGTITTGATDSLRTAMVSNYTWSFTTIPQVTLTSNPVAGGVSTGAGLFAQGSDVTVTATPNTGYTFTNWTKNKVIVSTSSDYLFKMAGNAALVANYAAVPAGKFAVNLSSSPVAGGTTTGAGSFTAGTTVTVTAKASSGYTFTNWTQAGTVASTSTSYPFKITGNRSLVAHFTKVAAGSFALNLSSSPTAGGTTTGSGPYTSGATATATAKANAGYNFKNWTNNGAIVSASTSYQVVMNSDVTLVANFVKVTPGNVALNLSSNPAIGGTTTGSGSYVIGTTATATAKANTGYSFTNWTRAGNIVSTSTSYQVVMTANTTLVANFTKVVAGNFALNLSSSPFAGGKTVGSGSFASGTLVTATATANIGYTFTNWTDNGVVASIAASYKFALLANRTLVANFTLIPPIGPPPINLGTAGNFTALTKSGISTTGVTSIVGNIGVSPISATSITGFGLIMDANGQSSHTPIVTGKVFAADYAAPTPAKMTTAVNDMQTAYTTGMGLVTPAPIVDLYAGNISGRILPPGLYKYNTGVLITNAGVTLTGGPNDTWVFQISQNLTVNGSAKITLLGGAQAKNIFWVVAGQATLGTNVNFSGIILSKTLISLNTGARVNGKLLAQTAVTLNAATVTTP